MPGALVLAAKLAITVATPPGLVSPPLALALSRVADMPWHDAGVTLEWSVGDRPGWQPDAPMLYVVFAERCAPSSGATPLASLIFVNGEPTRRIVVCVAQALAVASQDRDVAARVMGRAVAHEIGHYLYGREHAPAGLMRAQHSAADLCGTDPAPFAVVRPPLARTLPTR